MRRAAAVGMALVLVACGSGGGDEDVPSADERQSMFRESMETFGVDYGEALERAAEVCLIADDSEGDYDRAVTKVIAEYGSSVEVRLVVQNAEYICPEHRDLRLAAAGRFEG